MKNGEAAIETVGVKVVDDVEEGVRVVLWDDAKFFDSDTDPDRKIEDTTIKKGETFDDSALSMPVHLDESFVGWFDVQGVAIDFGKPLDNDTIAFAKYNHNKLKIDNQNGQYIITEVVDKPDTASIIIPKYVQQIADKGFLNCKAKTIEFEQKSRLETIQDNAFIGTAIDSIQIPDSVKTVGKAIFYNNNNIGNEVDASSAYLARIVANGSVKNWDSYWNGNFEANQTPSGAKFDYVSLVDAPNGVLSVDVDKTDIVIASGVPQQLDIAITVNVTVQAIKNIKEYSIQTLTGGDTIIVSRTQNGQNYIVGLQAGTATIQIVPIFDNSSDKVSIIITVTVE